MKTLALSGGDLVVGTEGHKTISGGAKITQELSINLGSQYGGDKFHPEFGSTLYQYFGEPLTEDTRSRVELEVGRVIQQYIDIQASQVLQDHLDQRATRFDASDVVTGVADLSVSIDYDTIKITGTLVTAAGSQVSISRTVQQ